MSLGLLLIILNYYSHSLLGKKEYNVKLSCALRGSLTSLYNTHSCILFFVLTNFFLPYKSCEDSKRAHKNCKLFIK